MPNSENRYYWIRLKTDFFDRDEIDFLMSQDNGCQYVVLYQMLCLRSANTNGELARRAGDVIIPYDVKKIVRDTKYFDIDTVTVALELFKKLGLIYLETNGMLVISGISQYIGSESASPAAIRKRRQRSREKLQSVTKCHDNGATNNHVEIEREIEIRDRDKSIELKSESESINTRALAPENRFAAIPENGSPSPTGRYGLYNNVILTDAEFAQLEIDYPVDYKNMIENLSVYMRTRGKLYADHYAILCKWAREDQERAKTATTKSKTQAELDAFYEMAGKFGNGE